MLTVKNRSLFGLSANVMFFVLKKNDHQQLYIFFWIEKDKFFFEKANKHNSKFIQSMFIFFFLFHY